MWMGYPLMLRVELVSQWGHLMTSSKPIADDTISNIILKELDRRDVGEVRKMVIGLRREVMKC